MNLKITFVLKIYLNYKRDFITFVLKIYFDYKRELLITNRLWSCISIYGKTIGLESWWNPHAWIITKDNQFSFLHLQTKTLSFCRVVEGEKVMYLARFRFEIKVTKLIYNFYYLDTIWHYLDTICHYSLQFLFIFTK